MAHPKIEAWISTAVGRKIDVDKSFGLQCKDVIDDLCLALFGDWINTIRPSDAAWAFDKSNPAYFEKVRNNHYDPNQVPPRGAIAVCDTSMGKGAGHIFVVENAGAGFVDAIEQDGLRQVATYRKRYDASIYDKMIGWLIPKLKETTMNDQEEQLAYQIVLGRKRETASTGRSALQFIKDAEGELKQQRTGYAQEVTTLTQQVTNLTIKLEEQKSTPVSLDSFTFGQLVTAAFNKLARIK